MAHAILHVLVVPSRGHGQVLPNIEGWLAEDMAGDLSGMGLTSPITAEWHLPALAA